MEKFNDKDKEFLTQAELYYSGNQPTWTDLEYDTYRTNFESRFGDVTKYVRSLNQGTHVDHRSSGRFKLNKVSIPSQFKERCDYLMKNDPDKSYWMYKYDGCSLVAYYSNGKLVQVCTKSAVEWGIDRTKELYWLFPEYVSSDIDSIQGEAVVKISEVGGIHKARGKANGLINSKYKSDEVHRLINVRAFKVGFTDLDESVERMIDALKSLPIPDHGKFQVAKEITTKDVGEDHIGTEDILYDGIVKYDMTNNAIVGYKQHSDEHLITKVIRVEWNPSPNGLMVPKLIFEPVYFGASYDDEGNLIGGIKVQKASCGSANRLFTLQMGANAIIEVFRANSTIPQVSAVIQGSTDYNLQWLDDRYYEDGYEFNFTKDPWSVIGNKGYYCRQSGIKRDMVKTMYGGIDYWYGIDNWVGLLHKDPAEFLQFVFYKILDIKNKLNKIDKGTLEIYSTEIVSGDSDKFDLYTRKLVDEIGVTDELSDFMNHKSEFMEMLNELPEDKRPK